MSSRSAPPGTPAAPKSATHHGGPNTSPRVSSPLGFHPSPPHARQHTPGYQCVRGTFCQLALSRSASEQVCGGTRIAPNQWDTVKLASQTAYGMATRKSLTGPHAASTSHCRSRGGRRGSDHRESFGCWNYLEVLCFRPGPARPVLAAQDNGLRDSPEAKTGIDREATGSCLCIANSIPLWLRPDLFIGENPEDA
jgi:hypothetical protein